MHKAAAMGAATAAPAIAVHVPGGLCRSLQLATAARASSPGSRTAAERQPWAAACSAPLPQRPARAGEAAPGWQHILPKMPGAQLLPCQRCFQIPAALPQCCSHTPCSPRWLLRPGSRSWRKASGGTSLGSLNFTPLAWGWLTSSRGAGSGKKQTLPQLLGRKAQRCLWSCRGKTSPQNPAPNGMQ